MKLLKTLMVMLPHHYPQLQPYGIWGESGTGGALTIVGIWCLMTNTGNGPVSAMLVWAFKRLFF